MNKKLHASAFVLLISFGNIASAFPEMSSAPREANEIAKETMSIPKIGEVSIAETGENMFSTFVLKFTQTYRVLLQDDLSGRLPMGRKIELRKGYESSLLKTEDGYPAICYSYSEMFIKHTECAVDKANSGVFEYAKTAELKGEKKLEKSAAYVVVPNPVNTSKIVPAFKREIIYQGTSKGVVKISFREFANDMARPAFSQDISYDLDPDGTTMIVFKGLKIQVLKASGAEIQYIVLRQFSDS
jgi:hypothetical protein